MFWGDLTVNLTFFVFTAELHVRAFYLLLHVSISWFCMSAFPALVILVT